MIAPFSLCKSERVPLAQYSLCFQMQNVRLDRLGAKLDK